ncbi:putative membrane protein, partial [mine drainage metagenome]
VALGFGLWAALWMIGWPLPLIPASSGASHGVLMVDGVLASLIGIERAVALERRVFYAAPLVTALGAISLVFTGNLTTAFSIVTVGALLLLLNFAVILRRQPAVHTAVHLIGAGCLVGGNLLGVLNYDIPFLIPLWGSFLVLLLAGERLELTRIRRMSLSGWLTFG